MTRRFDGLIVLITGATGGFGARMAERFAAEGARLLLSDLDDGKLVHLAGSLSAETAVLAGDVSDETMAGRLVKQAVERFGRLDIAINNAGVVQGAARLPQIPSEEARRVIEVDLLGVFYALKYQLPAMERQFRDTGRGGAIVNIASAAGVGGAPLLSVYAAAKHGVVGLTRTAALEYAARGIRVNAVCPAFARTAMVEPFGDPATPEADRYAAVTRGVPMRRLAEVDEVVEVILFAADPKNSFMTGHALSVDGGVAAL
jgi:NAD(P)-dependent dehydrogenase (short-subunit alcohol dehydrogenase family)